MHNLLGIRKERLTCATKGVAMFRGFSTIRYSADDVPAAVAWYRELLGIEPYFQRPEEGPPAYVEFRIGDYQHELGLMDRRYEPVAAQPGPGGVVMYWHVDDVESDFQRLLEMGASVYEPITPRGEGWVTASVVDPFGNILGLMHSPHYLEMLSATRNP
jgi:predicted enzyme related to lactoylglutathione lyase